MAEPTSWQALQAIKALVQGITVANRYRTDIGAGVIITDRSRLKLEGDTPVTLIVAEDIEENASLSAATTANSDMDFTIEVAVPFGAEDPELVAHRVAADLRWMLRRSMRNAPEGVRSLKSDLRVTFSSDVTEDAISFVLAQVAARAGLTETYPPA